jgi:hypothetical protein
MPAAEGLQDNGDNGDEAGLARSSNTVTNPRDVVSLLELEREFLFELHT